MQFESIIMVIGDNLKLLITAIYVQDSVSSFATDVKVSFPVFICSQID